MFITYNIHIHNISISLGVLATIAQCFSKRVVGPDTTRRVHVKLGEMVGSQSGIVGCTPTNRTPMGNPYISPISRWFLQATFEGSGFLG